ncbi:MAG: hypothetical protein ABUL62_14495 [Myxococcales bacterium]|jgi:hypothetical protein
MNKVLSSVLNAAGVTKSGGAPTGDFGDSSFPKGTLIDLEA